MSQENSVIGDLKQLEHSQNSQEICNISVWNLGEAEERLRKNDNPAKYSLGATVYAEWLGQTFGRKSRKE